MLELGKTVQAWGLSQKEAAKRLNITQPRLNDVLSGRINKFSLDALVNLCEAAQLGGGDPLRRWRQSAPGARLIHTSSISGC